MKQEVPSLILAHAQPSFESFALFGLWNDHASIQKECVPVGSYGPVLILGWEEISFARESLFWSNPWIQHILLQKEDFLEVQESYLSYCQSDEIQSPHYLRYRTAPGVSVEFWYDDWKRENPEQAEWISESIIESFLAREVVLMDLTCLAFQPDPLGMETLMGRHDSVFLKSGDSFSWIASADKPEKIFVDRVRNRLSGEQVHTLIALRSQILSARQGFHHEHLLIKKEEIADADEEVLVVRREEGYDVESSTGEPGEILRSVFAKALLIGVSDIHFEEQEIRVRKDGQLIQMMSCPLEKQRSMVSIVKGLAGMDQANFYNRQDGAFSLAMDEEWMNVRASAIPVKNHSRSQVTQKLVLRLLPRKRGTRKTIEQLGFTQEQAAILRRGVSRPQGLILITGPTGSGKTTTIYSLLSEISRKGRNIITLEDPIEYEIEGINQTQLDPLRGLTIHEFRKGYVRQDPDVLFLGEIRDLDTANFAVEASLTGHLVISTLHTESAVGAVHRLISLGVNTEILSQSLLLLQAQRLIRKLCQVCKKPVQWDRLVEKEQWLSLFPLGGISFSGSLYQPLGCPRCQGTGYSGRSLLVELVPVTQGMAQAIAIAKVEDLFALREVATKQGATTLYQDSLRLLAEGKLSLEDVDLYGNPWEYYEKRTQSVSML